MNALVGRPLRDLLRTRNLVPVDGPRPGSARDPLDSIEWPHGPTLETLGATIGAACGLQVAVERIPAKMRHPEVSGLTVVVGSTAHIYYDGDSSPLNQMQTVLHEYAHILHGDVRTNSDATHARTTFDSPVEKRAETTGMRLMDTMLRKHHASDLLDFFAGDGDVDPT